MLTKQVNAGIQFMKKRPGTGMNQSTPMPTPMPNPDAESR